MYQKNSKYKLIKDQSNQQSEHEDGNYFLITEFS